MKWTREHYLRFVLHFLIAHIPVTIFLVLMNFFTSLPLWLIAVIVLFFILTDTQSTIAHYINRYSFFEKFAINITDQNPTLPEKLIPTDIELKELGFQPVSQLTGNKSQQNETDIEWQYFSSEDKTYASMIIVDSIEIPVFVQFLTWFEGLRIVETRYPHGSSPHKESWHLTAISDSVDAAYNYHIRQVTKFAEIYGDPQINHDPIQRENLYKNHFGIHENISLYNLLRKILLIKRLAWASFFTAGFFIVITFNVMLNLISSDNSLPPPSSSHILGLIVSITVSAISFWIWITLLARGQSIEKAKAEDSD